MADEFYVGYLEKAPKEVSRLIRKVILVLALLLPLVAWLLAVNQRGFLESTYEYYQETEVTGFLIDEPFPAIQVDLGKSSSGAALVQTIPIVKFGKIGGEDLTQEYTGTRVSARGFLIYYDGKALLEITDDQNIKPAKSTPSGDFTLSRTVNYGAQGWYTGEILDAKCFFGVMKPGHGKPHRSCAIRCISGGIPAVLISREPSGNPTYRLIILDEDVDPSTLADFVGELVTIKGVAGEFYDWSVLKIEEIGFGHKKRGP